MMSESKLASACIENEFLRLEWLNPGESVTFEEMWEVLPGDYSIDIVGARKIISNYLNLKIGA